MTDFKNPLSHPSSTGPQPLWTLLRFPSKFKGRSTSGQGRCGEEEKAGPGGLEGRGPRLGSCWHATRNARPCLSTPTPAPDVTSAPRGQGFPHCPTS